VGIPERIREVLSLDPEAPAVGFEGRWTRWGELARAADALDRALAAAGQGPGAPVGLLLRNRPALVAALLGVVASRRCVVTLNPHQGDAGLAADLRALRLPAVAGVAEDWARAALASALAETGALGLCLGDGAVTAVPGLERPGPGPHREPAPGIAVEMLTSGTTGAPKRVRLGTRALEQSLLGAKHYESERDAKPRLREGVAILSAPLVHVGGLWRVLQCVADGRRFALLERFRVAPWVELVRRHRPKTASLVPAALRMVLEAGVPPEDLASLRSVVSGTAPLPPEDALAFETRYGIPVLASYGATEFAGGVAGWNLKDHARFAKAKRGSVGRAHPGCALRIVDPESGRELPAGERGLLEVRSAQLGPDAGWVRTTDLAHLDADGFLFIEGRADAAIIRGGFKVLPGEVERVLEEHPAVRAAAVVGLPDARLGAVPVAAVELREDAEPASEEQLLAFARERLTGYQVPVHLRIVEALPRTPSLKVSQPGVRALFE
jgi:long-chain acyl-CoA synthetase